MHITYGALWRARRGSAAPPRAAGVHTHTSRYCARVPHLQPVGDTAAAATGERRLHRCARDALCPAAADPTARGRLLAATRPAVAITPPARTPRHTFAHAPRRLAALRLAQRRPARMRRLSGSSRGRSPLPNVDRPCMRAPLIPPHLIARLTTKPVCVSTRVCTATCAWRAHLCTRPRVRACGDPPSTLRGGRAAGCWRAGGRARACGGGLPAPVLPAPAEWVQRCGCGLLRWRARAGVPRRGRRRPKGSDPTSWSREV